MSAPAGAGLANERTSLAWQRTALAHLVAGTLLARLLVRDPGWLLAFVLLVAAVAAGSAWSASVGLPSVPRHRVTAVLTVCTLLLAAVSAVVVAVVEPR